MKYSACLVVTFCLLLAACGPKKPAYSDIQTDAEGRAINQNSNGQAAASSPELSAPQPQPSPAAAKPAEFKVPEFIDSNTGQIKDLPSYPHATRVSIQYGPLQGTQTAMIVLQTKDSVDKIAAFYDRAIKTNGWKIVSDQRDQDVMKIEVHKGDKHEGLVRVIKDEKTGLVNIGLSRVEKPEQPKQ
jgi:hypothetical protein